MTIFSVHVADLQTASLTGDDEIFQGDEPIGSANKIAVNVLGGVAGVGAGPLSMLHDAASVVHRAKCMDEIVAKLPATLWDAREAMIGLAARSVIETAQYAAIGYSANRGRMVASVFHSENDFLPIEVREWYSPWIDAAGIGGADEHAVLAVAQLQLCALQRSVSRAAGGRLMLVTIAGATVMARPLFDLATGKRPIMHIHAERNLPAVIDAPIKIASGDSIAAAHDGRPFGAGQTDARQSFSEAE